MTNQLVKFGNSRIAVERSGSGPPLVVLHGENGARCLGPLMEELGRRFEVHAPRLAGWPETVRGPQVRTTRDVASIAQEYIEGLKAAVPVVGMSLGGWVAAGIAAAVPALISSLALIAPIGIKIGGRDDRDFADIYLLAAGEREALYYRPGFNPASDGGADRYQEKAVADDAVVRYCWQPYMHDPGLSSRLRRITAPSLVLSGEKDQFVVNPAYYRGYASLIPGSRHEVIAGAGHRLEEEAPTQVARRVAEFIASSTPAQIAAA